MKKLFLSLGFFSLNAFAQGYSVSSITFWSKGVVLSALNNGLPGISEVWTSNQAVKVKPLSSSVTVTCQFDSGPSVVGTPDVTGFLCPLPQMAQVNGTHGVTVTPSTGGVYHVNYLMTKSPVQPSTSCPDAPCVQAAINAALPGTTVDLAGTQLIDCGMISLDQVKPGVVIKNLSLTGNLKSCTIGNVRAHAPTTGVILDSLTVKTGTVGPFPSCAAVGSVVLFGKGNTLQNSFIQGGTANGIYLGGEQNKVINTTFTGVNTNNAASMTDCSGVLVSGFKGIVANSSFLGCNGSCIHIAPRPESSPLSVAVGNDVISGNLIQNALLNSFVGTIYSADGGAIYSGWNFGNNTLISQNVIQTINPNSTGNKACGGADCASAMYLDNNTSYYTVTNNFIDPGNLSFAAVRLNPQTYDSNPGGQLTSGNRTVLNNTLVGSSAAVAIQSRFKSLMADGTRQWTTSPDAVCPNSCNNKIVSSGSPGFTAGVGSNIPVPDFLSMPNVLPGTPVSTMQKSPAK